MNRRIPQPSSCTSRHAKWPVTPEVAGSSPVAPALAGRKGCLTLGVSDTGCQQLPDASSGQDDQALRGLAELPPAEHDIDERNVANAAGGL